MTRRSLSFRRVAAALAAALLLLLTACSSGGIGDQADSASAPAQGGGGDSDGEGAGGGSGAQDSGGATQSGDEAAQADPASQIEVSAARRIYRTELTVQVENLAAAAEQARTAAQAAGGYRHAESIDLPTAEDDRGEARLVLRVPVAELAEVTATVAAIGTELSRDTSVEEVEAALIDLDSRIATQVRSIERVRAYLEQAQSLEDLIEVEAELARREADLESLRARRVGLADQAAMSTLTVSFVMPPPAPVEEEPEEAGGFLDGLAAGWDALRGSTTVLLTVVGAVVPFALVAAVVGVPLLIWRRRRTPPAPSQT